MKTMVMLNGKEQLDAKYLGTCAKRGGAGQGAEGHRGLPQGREADQGRAGAGGVREGGEPLLPREGGEVGPGDAGGAGPSPGRDAGGLHGVRRPRRDDPRRRPRQPERSRRGLRLRGRALGLRQDDAPAGDRRVRGADRGPGGARRRRRSRGRTTSGASSSSSPTLYPWLTVRQNVEFGPKMRGIATAQRRELAERYLRMVRLWEFRDKAPYELSGGMQQRVAIARVLANDPRILLMDEPFGALDALTREHLQDEVLKIWRETRKTVFFITHSVEEAVYLATTVAVMSPRPGRILSTIEAPFSREARTADIRGGQVEPGVRRAPRAGAPPHLGRGCLSRSGGLGRFRRERLVASRGRPGRSYYSGTIAEFLCGRPRATIFAEMALRNDFDLTGTQRDAWLEQAELLQRVLALHRARSTSSSPFRAWAAGSMRSSSSGRSSSFSSSRSGTDLPCPGRGPGRRLRAGPAQLPRRQPRRYIAPVLICTRAARIASVFPTRVHGSAVRRCPGRTPTAWRHDRADPEPRRGAGDPHRSLGGERLQAHAHHHRSDAGAVSWALGHGDLAERRRRHQPEQDGGHRRFHHRGRRRPARRRRSAS